MLLLIKILNSGFWLMNLDNKRGKKKNYVMPHLLQRMVSNIDINSTLRFSVSYISFV